MINKQNYLNLKNLQTGGSGMQIFIKTLTGHTITLDIDSKESLSNIKQKIIKKIQSEHKDAEINGIYVSQLMEHNIRWISCGIIITNENLVELFPTLNKHATTHLVIVNTASNYKNTFLNIRFDGNTMRTHMETYINIYNNHQNITEIIKNRDRINIKSVKDNIHMCVRNIYISASDIPDNAVQELCTIPDNAKQNYAKRQTDFKEAYKKTGYSIWIKINELIKDFIKSVDLNNLNETIVNTLFGMPYTFRAIFIAGIKSRRDRDIATLNKLLEQPEYDVGELPDSVFKYTRIYDAMIEYNDSTFYIKEFPDYAALYTTTAITPLCERLLYDMCIQLLR